MIRKALATASLITSSLVMVPQAASAGSTVGSYIVVLQPGTPAAATAASMTRQYGGRLGFVYEHAISGFSVTRGWLSLAFTILSRISLLMARMGLSRIAWDGSPITTSC